MLVRYDQPRLDGLRRAVRRALKASALLLIGFGAGALAVDRSQTGNWDAYIDQRIADLPPPTYVVPTTSTSTTLAKDPRQTCVTIAGRRTCYTTYS